MKGQLSAVNLFGLFVTLIIYVLIMPVLNPMIADTVTTLQATPNEYTPYTVGLLHLVAFFMFLSIVITAIRYASQTGGQQ